MFNNFFLGTEKPEVNVVQGHNSTKRGTPETVEPEQCETTGPETDGTYQRNRTSLKSEQQV